MQIQMDTQSGLSVDLFVLTNLRVLRDVLFVF